MVAGMVEGKKLALAPRIGVVNGAGGAITVPFFRPVVAGTRLVLAGAGLALDGMAETLGGAGGVLTATGVGAGVVFAFVLVFARVEGLAGGLTLTGAATALAGFADLAAIFLAATGIAFWVAAFLVEVLTLGVAALVATAFLMAFATGLETAFAAGLTDFAAGLVVFPGFGADFAAGFAGALTTLVAGLLVALALVLPFGADFFAAFMLGLLASAACAPDGAGKSALSFSGSPCVIPRLGSFFVFFARNASVDWR
jgi:hypothetical protein